MIASQGWRPWLVPILVGALIRLWNPTHQPLWIDEILTLMGASLGEPFRWHDVWINPQGPLPHVWLRVWTFFLGSSDLALRLWAIFGGVLGLGCAALALRKWAGPVGLWGLWMFALSPFHWWYSQEVRSYGYMIAFAWLSLWALGYGRSHPGVRAWAALTGAVSAMILCNLSGLFLVPALAVAVWPWKNRTAVWTLLALTLAVLVAAPWIYVELSSQVDPGRLAGGISDIRGGETFSLKMLPYTAIVFLAGFGAAPALRTMHTGVSPGEWLAFAPGLAVLAFAACWFFGMSVKHRPRKETWVLWVLAVLPIVLAVVVAVLGLKAFNPRYVAVVLPAWITLLAMGFEEGVIRFPRITRIAFILLGGVMILSGVRQYTDSSYHREDFRSTALYVEGVEKENDLVLLEGVSGPFQRYYRGDADVSVLYRRYVKEPEGREYFHTLTAGKSRVLWVGSRLWYVDPDGVVLRWLDEFGTQTQVHQETGVLVRIYEREAD